MTADYENLDNSIKNLKMYAVDAFAAKATRAIYDQLPLSKLPFFSSSFTRGKNSYEIYIIDPGTDPVTAEIQIDRPKGDVGGGTVHANVDKGNYWTRRGNEHLVNPFLEHDFVRDFNTVRQAIEELVAPWRDLPKPSVIEGVYDNDFQNISTALAIPGASVGVASPTGESNIYSRLNLVKDASDAMAGTSWDAFRGKFYELLPPAINANNALAHYLASTIKAEGTLFKEARSLVAELVEKASQAFNAAGKNWSTDIPFDWKIVLDIAVLVAGAAADVVSGGAATSVVAASAVNLGLEVVKTVVDREERTAKGEANYDNVLDSFKNDMEAISSHVFKTEKEIGNNLNRNCIQAIRGSAHYDIKLGEITTGSSEELAIKDRDKVRTIYQTVMPDISNELAGIAGKTGKLAVPFANAIARHGKVGIGEFGPLGQFQSLAYVIASYLNELSEEAGLGGKNLEAAVNDIDAQDEDSQSALDSIINDIENYIKKND